MLSNKLPESIIKQIQSEINIPVSDKYKVEIKCECGIISEISSRALYRKWRLKNRYLCKSCHIKTYANDNSRIEKFRESFSKVASAEAYKAKASENGKKPWANEETRKRITEAVRTDNINNPKKKIARDIARRALQSKEWYADHIKSMVDKGHEKLRELLKHDIELKLTYIRNLNLNNDAVKEKHKKSTSVASKKRWESKEYRDKISAIVRNNWKNPEYRNAVLSAVKVAINTIEHKEKLSTISKSNWNDSSYRDKVRYSMSIAMKSKWLDDEYRTKAMLLFRSPEHRELLSKIVADRLKNDPDIRKLISTNTKATLQKPETRLKMAEARSKQSGSKSSLEVIVAKYLTSLNVEYIEQKQFGFYTVDFFIPKFNLIIECQGDYWHSLDNVKRNDESKATYIHKYFDSEIIYLWEHEFNANGKAIDIINSKLGINSNKCFSFSDIAIKKIEYSLANAFLQSYHYIGKGRGGIAIGAFLGDELIAVSVFSPPIRQNIVAQFKTDLDVRELSRFCIHPLYHVKNFASWMLAKSLKFVKDKFIFSYADTTVGHSGTIYKAANFNYHHTTQADYWYIDNDGYVMHKRTLYGKAKNLKMTEREFADLKGYTKIYGKEKLCFTYCQK